MFRQVKLKGSMNILFALVVMIVLFFGVKLLSSSLSSAFDSSVTNEIEQIASNFLVSVNNLDYTASQQYMSAQGKSLISNKGDYLDRIEKSNFDFTITSVKNINSKADISGNIKFEDNTKGSFSVKMSLSELGYRVDDFAVFDR